jgi:mRNA interferase MazF
MTNYEFGDVVLVAFPQSGTTARKRRPALVVLDIGDTDIVLAPITTRERSGRGDYKLRDWAAVAYCAHRGYGSPRLPV